MPPTVLALWSLLGCSLGPQHPSVLEDVQVVSVITNPPEGYPGEQISVQVTVANPRARAVEVLIWTCAIYEGKCAEWLEYVGTPERWLSVDTLEGDTLYVTREVPRDVDQLMLELEVSELSTALLVLACEEGVCPIIAEVQAALASGIAPQALAEKLADPIPWMAELPIAGVSLTGRDYTISLSGERNTNPWVEARFAERDDEPIVISEVDQEFAFMAQDAEGDRIYAYAYTTIGRFEERRERVYDGVVRHYLLTQGQTGSGTVYIVFEDGEGGAALWRREVSLR